MSEKIVRAEKEKVNRVWIPLTDQVREALDASVGDWILLKGQEDKILIEKVPVEEVEVDPTDEVMEMARAIRGLEG